MWLDLVWVFGLLGFGDSRVGLILFPTITEVDKEPVQKKVFKAPSVHFHCWKDPVQMAEGLGFWVDSFGVQDVVLGFSLRLVKPMKPQAEL